VEGKNRCGRTKRREVKERFDAMSGCEKKQAIATDDKEQRNLDDMDQFLGTAGMQLQVEKEGKGKGEGDHLFQEAAEAIFAKAKTSFASWTRHDIRKHAQFRLFQWNEGTESSLPAEIAFDHVLAPFLSHSFRMEENETRRIVVEAGFEKASSLDGSTETLKDHDHVHMSSGEEAVQFRLKDGVHTGFLARIPKLRKDNEKMNEANLGLAEQLIQQLNVQKGSNVQIPSGLTVLGPGEKIGESREGDVSAKERACNGCGISWKKSMPWCSRCENVRCCSPICQRGDWKKHKKVCSQGQLRVALAGAKE
jgi:hypothetical protein